MLCAAIWYQCCRAIFAHWYFGGEFSETQWNSWENVNCLVIVESGALEWGGEQSKTPSSQLIGSSAYFKRGKSIWTKSF